MYALLPALVAAVMVMSMYRASADEPSQSLGAHGLRLLATFIGTLPYANGSSIRYHLNLWPDQVFHLRQTWLEEDRSSDDIGRWSVDPSRQALILHGGREMPLLFAIERNDRLRKLEMDGSPIESELNHELTSADKLEPLSLSLPLHGMFTYMADAPRFAECMTDRSYPVAMEGDYLALERAYLEKRSEPGAPLMATIDGQITDRPPMEGDGTIRTIVVDRFVNVWPLEQCERWKSEPTLDNTYWRIVRLGDATIEPMKGRREPHLLLGSGEPRFRATVGCNQMIGGYEASDNNIRFTDGPTTLMACPPPLDATERKLSQLLTTARSYQMSGQTMEFFDESGAPIALFQAAYF